jgi:hypothetical protein
LAPRRRRSRASSLNGLSCVAAHPAKSRLRTGSTRSRELGRCEREGRVAVDEPPLLSDPRRAMRRSRRRAISRQVNAMKRDFLRFAADRSGGTFGKARARGSAGRRPVWSAPWGRTDGSRCARHDRFTPSGHSRRVGGPSLVGGFLPFGGDVSALFRRHETSLSGGAYPGEKCSPVGGCCGTRRAAAKVSN